MALLGDIKVYGVGENPDKDPKTRFSLEYFEGEEVLGKPYSYRLSLLADDADIPVDSVLGESLTIRIPLGQGQFRFFNGVVTFFAKAGVTMTHSRYLATLNPTLSKLGYTRDCRIFSTGPGPATLPASPTYPPKIQTTLDIVDAVLKARGIDHAGDAVTCAHANQRDRDYCVQYRESDLNFVQRLLEEEGVYYFFKHESGKHKLVLADSISAHGTQDAQEDSGDEKGGGEKKDHKVVPYVSNPQNQKSTGEHFWSLKVSGGLYPDAFRVLQGYDETRLRPQAPFIGDRTTGNKHPGTGFEDYDYPGGLLIPGEAGQEAGVRAEAEHVANTRVEVEGNTLGLGLGDLVMIDRGTNEINPFWSAEDFNKEYLITAATYTISSNHAETGNGARSDEPFRARYSLLDAKVNFRPYRSAVKPRIEGPQTAVVVGPKAEKGKDADEIWTDAFGRVKVQFDWDRLHEGNDRYSCWVRVAQIWAGSKWGAFHVPRVGHEVVVEFLDGDPDRPIITGRLYNANNQPPYPTPTQSGIKSRSTKGGNEKNFNEIRFEDLKGKEELHMQAERDMSTHVKRNQSTNVDGDRTVTVGGNQTTTVTKDEKQIYKKTRTMTVTETNEDTIKLKHKGTYEGGREEEVTKGDKLTVFASDKETIVHGIYKITADSKYSMSQGADNSITANADGIWIRSAGCDVVMANGVLAVSGASEVILQSAPEGGGTDAGGLISVKSDGTIEIKGKKILVQGDTEVAIKGTAIKLNDS